MLPSYLCCLIKQKAVEKYFLRSQNYYTLSVPLVRSELGKRLYVRSSVWLESSAIELEITKFDVFGWFQKSYSANGNWLNESSLSVL